MELTEVEKLIISEDVIKLIKECFNKSNLKKIYLSKGHFYSLFKSKFQLKYQKEGNFLIDSNILLSIIRELDVCSLFKFRKSKIKRFKFLKYKVLKHA
jgi:hypothetical protein